MQFSVCFHFDQKVLTYPADAYTKLVCPKGYVNVQQKLLKDKELQEQMKKENFTPLLFVKVQTEGKWNS